MVFGAIIHYTVYKKSRFGEIFAHRGHAVWQPVRITGDRRTPPPPPPPIWGGGGGRENLPYGSLGPTLQFWSGARGVRTTLLCSSALFTVL